MLPRVRDIRRVGSAALDLCAVACGRVDGYYEVGLQPWDRAAGQLIATEAGARVTDLAGVGPPGGDTGVLAAPPALHGGLVSLLADAHVWANGPFSVGAGARDPTSRRENPKKTVVIDPYDVTFRQDGGVGTRILTVEDDERIRASVKLALEDEGWVVVETANGEQALESFGRAPTDVVLIDIMLPGIDGFEVCRSIRKTSDVPIIMVTARNDTHDIVAGLEAGADDYLTKPFAPKELSARIRALLRRVRSSDHGSGKLVFGDLEILPDEGVVMVGTQQVHLTKTEFRLLVELASSAGRVFSRRGPAGAGLGLRLLRRRSAGRRAHPPPAHQGRAGRGQPAARRDGPGPGLQAAGVTADALT